LTSTIANYSGVDPSTRNTTTTVSLDALDRLAGVTDPTALTTSYSYDGLSNRKSLQSPDTGTSTDTYDAAGNRLTHTDANGIVSMSTYDALNRLTNTSYVNTALNVNYRYDVPYPTPGCEYPYTVGRLTAVEENGVITTFCYGPFGGGRPSSKSQSNLLSNTGTELFYQYTAAGRLINVQTPTLTSIVYAYDSDGRLNNVQATIRGATAPPTVVSNIAYLPFGPISSYTLGNGQTITRTYDANYRLTDLTSPALALHFRRDPMGNIIALGNASGANPATETYSYDPLYRLTGVIDAGTALESYTYNPTGDRLSKMAPGLATGMYLYTTGTHHLASIGNASRANDADGNTTGSVIGGNTYGFAYNGRNRLTLAQINGLTAAGYTYNAMGERISKAAVYPQSVTDTYAYDEAGHLTGEYTNANPATHREYIWMGDIPVAVIDDGRTTSTVNYVTADQLNTPRVVTNNAGAVIWQWAYQGNPFGEKQPTSTTGYVLNLRYPGQYYDAESGTNYNMFRNYEPTVGRYQQSDPSGLAGGMSTYAYVGGDPLSEVDPQGLACPANLKAAGTCIDSSNFNPANSDGNTVAGTAETDEVAILNMKSLDTSDSDEHYASVTDTDSFLPATGSGKDSSNGYTGNFTVNEGTTQAICHSHPRGRGFWPTPGFGDNAALAGC
jgi:RHS repeat-associated protein